MAAGPEQIEKHYIEDIFATPNSPDWDAARKEVSKKIDEQLNTILAETYNPIKALETLFNGCNCEAFNSLENSAQSGSRTYAFVYTLAVSLAEYARNIDDERLQKTIIEFIGEVNTAYKTKLITLFWGKTLPDFVNITWLLSTQVPLLIQLFNKVLSTLRENNDTSFAKKKLLVSLYLSIRCIGFAIELKGGNYISSDIIKTIDSFLEELCLCYNTVQEETRTLQERQEISEHVPSSIQNQKEIPEKDHYTAAEYCAVFHCFKDSISIDTPLATTQQNLEILISILQLNNDLSGKVKKRIHDELTEILRNVEQLDYDDLFKNLNSVQAILIKEDEKRKIQEEPISSYSSQFFYRSHERKVLQDSYEGIQAATIKKKIDAFINSLDTVGIFTYHDCARCLMQAYKEFDNFNSNDEEEKIETIRNFCTQARGLIQTKRNSQFTKIKDAEFDKFIESVANIEVLIPDDPSKSRLVFDPCSNLI